MPANYTALDAAWNAAGLPAGVSGTALAASMTPQQKLAAMQGWTVAAPLRDVPVGAVTMYLASQGKLTALRNYAATAAPTAGTNAAGVNAALDLMEIVGNPQATIAMSQPAIAAGVAALLAALVADTANSGIAAADQSALLALAAGAPLEWATAPGGASLPGQLSATDLILAGLATTAEFPGA